MKNLMFIVSTLFLTACGDAYVDSQEDYAPTDVVLEEQLALSKKGDKVQVCHYPPSSPSNVQVLSIGAQAANSHVANHSGDGIIGVDYDENCQPLDCPCFSRSDLDTHFPSGFSFDYGPIFQDVPPTLTDISARMPLDGGRRPAVNLFVGLDFRGAFFCGLVDERLGDYEVIKPISNGEQATCASYIRDKALVEGYPTR